MFLKNNNVTINGIGVSATGQIDVNTGTVIGTNGKIPQYEGSEIKKEMEHVFGVPTFVLNDANAAVLGKRKTACYNDYLGHRCWRWSSC